MAVTPKQMFRAMGGEGDADSARRDEALAAKGAASVPVPVLVYLTGPRRGHQQRLCGDRLILDFHPPGEVRVARWEQASDAHAYAWLRRECASYALESVDGLPVWINGAQVKRRTVLASGDVMELGRSGVLLRFRLYPADAPSARSLNDAFSDCFDCARYDHGPVFGRVARLFGGLCSEMNARTALWFRASVVAALVLLGVSNVALTYRSLDMSQRLTQGEVRASGISQRVADTRQNALTRAELGTWRTALENDLSSTSKRIRTLERRAEATARVIAEASQSVVLLQGAFGFVDGESGRPLRFVLGADGDPLRSALGGAAVSLDGEGPIAETVFTGTAFVANGEGLLITNRHVAVPWEGDQSVEAFAAKGLVPAMHRFIGYLPGVEKSFEVEMISVSEDADLAVLRSRSDLSRVPHLDLRPRVPRPGEEVVVIGYPTGFRALLARTDERFVDELTADGELDFWGVAERLAEHGSINPLATRGIVSQVANAAVVYDAETAQGGSGGPVLGLDGKVVAINAAILPEFSGSNIGVPVHRAVSLLTPKITPDAVCKQNSNGLSPQQGESHGHLV